MHLLKITPLERGVEFLLLESAKSLINDFLLSKGIAVRYLLSYGLENALRITLGTKEELNKTTEIFKEFQRNNG